MDYDKFMKQNSDRLIQKCFKKHENDVDKFAKCGVETKNKLEQINKKFLFKATHINIKLRQCNMNGGNNCEQDAQKANQKYKKQSMKQLQSL